MERKEISKAVLKRLPGYLSYLKSLPEDSSPYISATSLANALDMGEVLVRKDLAMVSDGGRPKVGYLREGLIDDIGQFLGYDNTTSDHLITNFLRIFTGHGNNAHNNFVIATEACHLLHRIDGLAIFCMVRSGLCIKCC